MLHPPLSCNPTRVAGRSPSGMSPLSSAAGRTSCGPGPNDVQVDRHRQSGRRPRIARSGPSRRARSSAPARGPMVVPPQASLAARFRAPRTAMLDVHNEIMARPQRRLRRRTAQLDQPVVVGAAARLLELRARPVTRRRPAGGIEHLGAGCCRTPGPETLTGVPAAHAHVGALAIVAIRKARGRGLGARVGSPRLQEVRRLGSCAESAEIRAGSRSMATSVPAAANGDIT